MQVWSMCMSSSEWQIHIEACIIALCVCVCVCVCVKVCGCTVERGVIYRGGDTYTDADSNANEPGNNAGLVYVYVIFRMANKY
jgi:hypothetical protein